jgi:hypothetical protein
VTILFVIGTVIDLAPKKSYITEVLQAITVFLFFIDAAFKVIWIFIGVFIFVVLLDFKNCTETVIMYCSVEFVVFLTAFSFIIIRGLIRKFIKFPKTKPKKKANTKEQELPS